MSCCCQSINTYPHIHPSIQLLSHSLSCMSTTVDDLLTLLIPSCDVFVTFRSVGYSEGRHYPQALLEKQAQLLHWNGQAKPWKNPRQFGAKLWMKYYIPDPLLLQKPSQLDVGQPKKKVLKKFVDINGDIKTKRKKLLLLRRQT